jgi:hypothetical protein
MFFSNLHCHRVPRQHGLICSSEQHAREGEVIATPSAETETGARQGSNNRQPNAQASVQERSRGRLEMKRGTPQNSRS